MARRARVVLLCADGWPIRQIGLELGMAIVAAATSEKDADDPVAAWTHQDLADKLGNDG